MSYYANELSHTDRLFGKTELRDRQASMIKATYMYLSLSVFSAMIGGYVGATTPAIVNFFSGGIGIIATLAILWGLPMIAMAARHNPVLGLAALILDGFGAGLVLAPLLFLASMIAPNLVFTAFLMTAVVFFSITGYVMTSKKTFNASRGVMAGLFFGAVALFVLNMFVQMTILSLILSAVIGILGVLTLVYATSDVLNNPEIDSPIPGALSLFAGLFNVFISILQILMIFTGSDD